VVWYQTLLSCRELNGKIPMYSKEAKETLENFTKAADYEFLCEKISGQKFNSIEEHSEFINNGGCEKLIDLLAK